MPTTLLDDQLRTRQGKQLPRSGFPVLCPPRHHLAKPLLFSGLPCAWGVWTRSLCPQHHRPKDPFYTSGLMLI